MAKSLCGKWPIALLLLTAITGNGIAGQEHVPDLLKISHPLRSPFDKHEDSNDQNWRIDDYAWEGGGESLIFVGERYAISRYNLKTHAQTPLSSAPERLVNRERPAKRDIGSLEVSRSPDGKWLQWHPHWGCTYLFSLVGPEHLRSAIDTDVSPQHFVWLADSKHYASFVSGPTDDLAEVYLADIRHPGKEQVLSVVPNNLVGRTGVIASLGLENRILFVNSNFQFVTTNSSGEKLNVIPTLTLYSCTFGKTANLRTQAAIPVSKGAQISEAALSSDGKRLAWIEETPNEATSLWVARIDGTGKREIGAVPPRTPKSNTYVSHVQWLPDNQHLSFVCADTLYTVHSK